MTSFWAIGEASRTRSMASKLASRSVAPWARVSSWISFWTSARLGEGSPITTRGGEPIKTRLTASPRRESPARRSATVLACSKRLEPPAESTTERPMLSDESRTKTRWVRLPGITLPRPSRNGLAIARTTQITSRQRIAKSSHCSIRIRRWFLRIASTKNRMAAHRRSRNFRRFQRCNRIGAAAAASPYKSGALANPNAQIKGGPSSGNASSSYFLSPSRSPRNRPIVAGVCDPGA